MSSDAVYYRLFRKDLQHYNHRYTTGFNKATEPFGIVNTLDDTHGDNPWSGPNPAVLIRGISFSTRNVVWKWLDLYCDIYWIAEVRVLPTSTVIDLGGGHYLTDQCLISYFTPIQTFLSTAPEDERRTVMVTCISGFTYIPNPTDKECLEAVFRFGHLLQFIKPQLITAKLCRVAVTNNPWAFQFVPGDLRTDELLLLVPEAIRRTLRV